MLTETSHPEDATGAEAVDWLWKEWASALRVRNSGVPLVGFTWYPLLDQILPGLGPLDDARANPAGLFDLNREIRPVGSAYARLVGQWHRVLPTQSVCLIVPVTLPSEHNDRLAVRHRGWLAELFATEASRAPRSPFR